MPCFFCDSSQHLSHFCDIYKSKCSRIQKAESKKCCALCLKAACDNKDSCKCYQKCYICLEDHPIIHCTAPKLFLPNINKDLYKRYHDLFEIHEKYFLAFLDPLMFKSLVKPLEIIGNEFENYNINVNSGKNRILKNTISLRYNSSATTIETNLNNIICQARWVTLKSVTIFAHNFFQLLSPQTEVLDVQNTTLIPKVKFAEVLDKVPNIEKLILYNSDIITGTDWPKVLLNFPNKTNLKELKITITGSDCNADDLQKVYETVRNVSL